jgi:hypothetical protein
MSDALGLEEGKKKSGKENRRKEDRKKSSRCNFLTDFILLQSRAGKRKPSVTLLRGTFSSTAIEIIKWVKKNCISQGLWRLEVGLTVWNPY